MHRLLNLFKPPSISGRETVKLTGEFTMRQWRDGKVIREFTKRNLIVNAGKALAAGLLNGVSSGAFTYIAIGTSATAAAATDVGLGAEITTGGIGRASATCTRVTTTVTDDTAQLVKTFEVTSAGPFSVVESGIFNAASGVTMLCRQTFATVTLSLNDKLEVTWKIAVS